MYHKRRLGSAYERDLEAGKRLLQVGVDLARDVREEALERVDRQFRLRAVLRLQPGVAEAREACGRGHEELLDAHRCEIVSHRSVRLPAPARHRSLRAR